MGTEMRKHTAASRIPQLGRVYYCKNVHIAVAGDGCVQFIFTPVINDVDQKIISFSKIFWLLKL